MLVATADNDIAVTIEIAPDSPIISNARPRPALPTTKPRRRNRMIPRIVRMLGVNTPAKVPRPFLVGVVLRVFFESGMQDSVWRRFYGTIRAVVSIPDLRSVGRKWTLKGKTPPRVERPDDIF
jgi:hypothetical protein